MVGNFEMGGLNMIDIGSYVASLGASWVSRFVSGEMDNWKLILFKYFSSVSFNLSGLPSHMNLKHLLSISFLYLSGTTHALATHNLDI
jgi:hypothetical protein